jgi:hypothetical protein
MKLTSDSLDKTTRKIYEHFTIRHQTEVRLSPATNLRQQSVIIAELFVNALGTLRWKRVSRFPSIFSPTHSATN